MNLTYLEIDYSRSTYDAMSPTMRAAFTHKLLISWLYHEHALEGVVLSEEDIDRALTNKPCRNYCDGRTQRSQQMLHRAILSLLDGPRDAGKSMDMEWLKQLHTDMSDPQSDQAGRYRKRDSSPGVYNLDVVPHASISYYLRKFMTMYEEQLIHMHPVRAAALAHWEFMRVFPFDERTGLVGRLMLNYILISNDYPPAIIHANDRHLYFAALSSHPNDLVPLIVESIKATIGAAEHFSQSYFLNKPQQAAF